MAASLLFSSQGGVACLKLQTGANSRTSAYHLDPNLLPWLQRCLNFFGLISWAWCCYQGGCHFHMGQHLVLVSMGGCSGFLSLHTHSSSQPPSSLFNLL